MSSSFLYVVLSLFSLSYASVPSSPPVCVCERGERERERGQNVRAEMEHVNHPILSFCRFGNWDPRIQVTCLNSHNWKVAEQRIRPTIFSTVPLCPVTCILYTCVSLPLFKMKYEYVVSGMCRRKLFSIVFQVVLLKNVFMDLDVYCALYGQ